MQQRMAGTRTFTSVRAGTRVPGKWRYFVPQAQALKGELGMGRNWVRVPSIIPFR